MTNELAVVEARPLTATEIKANVNLIQQVMDAVMIKDVHYGKIPGTNKPTLYKAGAEKLLSTFKIGVEPIVVDLCTADEAKFRVLARGYLIADGRVVGQGVGEASSNEEKYKWRKAVCDEEYDATPEDRRREKWGKDYNTGKPYTTKQVRTCFADVANTILKMAKKRAQIDLTLTVTAASDVFDQDLEDQPDAPVGEARKTVEMPKEKLAEQPPQDSGEPEHRESPPGASVLVGVVEAVSKKPGRNAGTYRYGFKIGDAWYNSFSDSIAEVATKGANVEIEFTTNDKGFHDITNARAA